jgi:flagellar motor switch protein FliN
MAASDSSRQILDKWIDTLAQVLESMTDQRPSIGWQPAGSAPSEADDAALLWWEQPFGGPPGCLVWVGAPAQTWEHAGTLTLKVAGLETVASNEARNTWIEILSQSLSVLSRSIGGLAGTEVVCQDGGERPPAPEVRDWITVTLGFSETALAPLLVGFSPALAALLASPPHKESNAAGPPALREPAVEEHPVTGSRTMELLLEVELPVSISFGKTTLPLREVLKLTTGSIVELNRTASDPVEVLVNQRLIARGEVVVVDGNYGVRIQQIASRHDRLRSIP